MTSHMYIGGVLVLQGLSDTFTNVANWAAIASGSYPDYWRCGLGSAMGTYSVKTASETTGFTELSTAGNYTVLGVAIDGSSHNQNSVNVTQTPHLEYVSSQGDSSPTWANLTETTVAYAALWPCTATAANNPVLCAYDFGGTYPCTAGTFAITFGTDNTVAHTCFSQTPA